LRRYWNIPVGPSVGRRSGLLLNRFEKKFLTIASIVFLVVTVVNSVLMSQGYFLSLYVRLRDIAVIAVALALLIGNLAAMRKNVREKHLFLFIVGFLTVIATVHSWRLLHGGLPCR
jgi:hypothetical protein